MREPLSNHFLFIVQPYKRFKVVFSACFILPDVVPASTLPRYQHGRTPRENEPAPRTVQDLTNLQVQVGWSNIFLELFTQDFHSISLLFDIFVFSFSCT